MRTVAAWHHKPTLKPKSEMQQLLDTALEEASPAVKTRFTQFLAGFADPATIRSDPTQAPGHPGTGHDSAATADAERRLSTEANS